ncbi:MAG TPA: coenzyme F420-0:L-glutamate ligase [Acidimicrobiales bacterium]|nr:coenzyme F420-0:L-glutamate ligase [Acidimicrobiales bacterium]
MSPLTIWPVEGLPEIRAGAALAQLIAERTDLRRGDVVVVTSKVVSKSEGRVVEIDADDPEAKLRLAEAEAVRVLRRRGELVITETHHGFVCASSGVDLSNVEEGYAVLLPLDADRSARRLRDGLRAASGVEVAVVVTDTFGRPWRRGLTDVAIGVAGVAAVADLRGLPDALGRTLTVTEVAVADEIAAAADLVMGKSAGIPAAVVRGVEPSFLRSSSVAAELVRPPAEDLFR